MNRKSFLCAVGTLLTLVMANAGHAATITLAGFEGYVATSGGADANGSGYFFSDNSNAGVATAQLTETSPSSPAQTKAINFPLALGSNTFSIYYGYPPSNNQPYAGIGLFFTSDGTSFNPTNLGTGDPNLSIFGAGTGAFTVTPASTSVPDYASNSNTFQDISYGGATSFSADGLNVSVTSFSYSNSSSSGTLTLNVTAVPEPALAGAGILGLGMLCLKRRNRQMD